MRIVPDSNVLISAFFFKGVPKQFMEKAIRGRHRIFISNAILDELRSTMQKPYFRKRMISQNVQEEIIADYRRMATIIDPASIPSVCRDPKDNMVLACAVEAKADWLVTGDGDLQVLGWYGSVKIISPADALARIS